MVTEAFVARDQLEWSIDIGATLYISGNRNSFTTYELLEGDKVLHLGKSSSTKVVRKRTVELKITFGKMVTLIDCKFAKEILDTLKAIHLAEEVSSKKFLVSNYIESKMVDDYSITEKAQQFQLIANKIAINVIALDKNIHVGAIVSTHPPFWKEYRSKLLHKKEDLTLEQLL
ncbi:hypothetical protein H5410_022029 [Solanum commersonii]|uniref:Uncharacterized protein n=1 Tax=Solanum commersonii TaxID=4109 RepID=A0A9J5ZGW9_SOLCO|nr:hypothetical protein H5410_022029 [Solanum commersonii]